MFKRIIETVVGTAIGLAAVYFVGKLAFEAGHEMAEAEHRYNELNNPDNDDDDEEEPTDNKNKQELLPECIENTEYVVEDVKPKQVKPSKKTGRFGLFTGLKNIFSGGKASVLGNLVGDPEDHKLEAYIQEGEVHINIKKRKSITNERGQ